MRIGGIRELNERRAIVRQICVRVLAACGFACILAPSFGLVVSGQQESSLSGSANRTVEVLDRPLLFGVAPLFVCTRTWCSFR